MRSIPITFHPDVPPERQKAVLEEVNNWNSIEAAGQLMPDAENDEIRRMAYAYVSDDAEIEAVSKQLEAVPEIEAAAPPPERRLISPENP